MAETEELPDASCETAQIDTGEDRPEWGGQLAEELRAQNWTAVIIQFCVVVSGIVIGFQLSGWGQSRADSSREETYLRQLAADLTQTELDTDAVDGSMLASEQATYALHRTFYTPTRPSSDSLLNWLWEAEAITIVRPVLGTTEALVASGDIRLIRDDSLRTKITTYLDKTRRVLQVQQDAEDSWEDAHVTLQSAGDLSAKLLAVAPRAHLDSLMELGQLPPVLPLAESRVPFPFDANTFLTSFEMNHAAYRMSVAKTNLRDLRAAMRTDASELRERVIRTLSD